MASKAFAYSMSEQTLYCLLRFFIKNQHALSFLPLLSKAQPPALSCGLDFDHTRSSTSFYQHKLCDLPGDRLTKKADALRFSKHPLLFSFMRFPTEHGHRCQSIWWGLGQRRPVEPQNGGEGR